ncbi:MAG TPA: tetratricopeptide repeat-containing glycosyltransferase family protein [Humisphaera sp.]|jgi:Tfp pilus assembly protein PilF|nr:tetratricopeptide repeat-containing glycosyltransferase family protein [Humisphaera sp.]
MTNDFDLALQHHQAGRLSEAEAIYRRILAQEPNHAGALNNLGTALHHQGKSDEAIEIYQRALTLRPDHAGTLSNLGGVYRELGRNEEAIPLLQRAVALDPDLAIAHNNLALAYRDTRNIQSAQGEFVRALTLQPQDRYARWNLGMLRLLQGDYSAAWPDYEARLGLNGTGLQTDITGPLWDGSDLHGQRILLHCEQGAGDTIQFLRFVPLVKQRGGKIILQTQPSLCRLLQGQLGVEQVISVDDARPPYDVHCPIMSLASRFGTTLDTIPARVPYLNADPQLVERWRERLGASDGRLNVGISWGGNPVNQHDRFRSVPLSALAPLAGATNVRFISLQKGPWAQQIKSPPAGLEIIDWTDDLQDFADTAALMSALDMVLTVCTATAHLAGALGRKTWVMLCFPCDWRWLTDRSDSPWYPTMRLFRQTQFGLWDQPVQQVLAELKGSGVGVEVSDQHRC